MSKQRTQRRLAKFALYVLAATTLTSQARVQPALAAPEPEWLTVLNLYRASAGLGSVTENPAASEGSTAHSEYLVKNRARGHGEDPGRPGYSAIGVRGGETGNVVTGSGGKVGERSTIEGWMTAPFHGLAMIDPNSQRYGYGLVSNGSRWASTLSHSWDGYAEPGSGGATALEAAIATVERTYPDVNKSSIEASQRGMNMVVNFSGRRFLVVGEKVRELQREEPAFSTVVWPGNGSGVPLVRYAGSEWPDPITACKGWTEKAGLPILIHRSIPTLVKTATVTDTNGASLPVCSIDSDTYTNPDPGDQDYASNLLETSVIVIPKNPLTPGHSYRVQVKLEDGETLDWTFGVTTDGSIQLPPGSPLEGRSIPGTPFQADAVKQAKPATTNSPKSPAKPAPVKKPKAKK